MNNFDELIGADVAETDRERLLAVHELLVEAGPPPELSAALRDAPRPRKVGLLRSQTRPRKVPLLAAAVIVLGVTFTLGFATGHRSSATAKPVRSLVLSGTALAPHAHATLDVRQEVSGNWPMTLHVTGLPKVAAPEYYYVWLVRDGKPLAPCGDFVVSKPSGELTLNLTAPYKLEKGDSWVVTRYRYQRGKHSTGKVVLQPVTT